MGTAMVMRFLRAVEVILEVAGQAEVGNLTILLPARTNQAATVPPTTAAAAIPAARRTQVQATTKSVIPKTTNKGDSNENFQTA